MGAGIPFWIGFNVAVLALIALDLLVLHRREREISMTEAAVTSAAWVLLSLGFAAYIWFSHGTVKGVEFLTGYVIEYSLSADNLFLFVVIFATFNVPARHQHRVLLWGILGALVMRGVVIALGVQLVSRFEWVLYLFGVFILVTGLRMFVKRPQESPAENFAIAACRKVLRVTPEFHDSKFLVRTAAGWMCTPLVLALVVIDVMDLIFAFDSIPAVFAITTDPFIVYTSNICAILGLRSLYFLLAGMAARFERLHYGLAAVLTFVGVKMLLAGVMPISAGVSLLVVAVLLGASVVWSLASAPANS